MFSGRSPEEIWKLIQKSHKRSRDNRSFIHNNRSRRLLPQRQHHMKIQYPSSSTAARSRTREC